MKRFPRFRAARREGVSGVELMRNAVAGHQRWWLWARLSVPAITIIVLHLFLFPPSRSVKRIELEVGSITSQEIRAPFRFTAPRPSYELDEARRNAAQRVEPVYRRVEGAQRRTEAALQEFFTRVAEKAAADSVPAGERVTQLHELYPGVAVAHLNYLLQSNHLEKIQPVVENVVRRKMEAGIVDITPRGTYQNIRVLGADGEEAEPIPVSSVSLGYRLEESLREDMGKHLRRRIDRDCAVDIALYMILPDLSYDDAETERLRQVAVESVPVEREFARNERIVGAGSRVTRDHVAVLEALERARVERALAEDSTIGLKMRLGRILLLSMILLGGYRLVRQVDPTILRDANRYLLLNTLLGSFLLLAVLVLRHPDWGGAVAVPVVLLSMLATILYGEASAYRIAAVGILLLVLVPEAASPMIVVWAAVSVAAVRTLRRVRNRNQFYKALGGVAATYLLSVSAFELSHAAAFSPAMRQVGLGVASGAASTALTLFLLPLFEALFGVTTELTLLELSDLNHPLLRRMSLESPGTFHHSQVVGTLAEAGSRAIGANSLLTRVGANFHDIGKMLKPRYFAENQGQGNPHDELTPSMSALVIASHVREGIELGREWGLPWSVLAFIPEHHGTSVMQYFYKKALEEDSSGTVKVDDFRYPGPKPQSKETAILMLADGAEASVRSLIRPTASRVREMVRKIFEQKMSDGELDECGLTLRELAMIREAFIPVLLGIHHQRVAYPGQREHEAQKEKESLEARARARRGGASVVSGT